MDIFGYSHGRRLFFAKHSDGSIFFADKPLHGREGNIIMDMSKSCFTDGDFKIGVFLSYNNSTYQDYSDSLWLGFGSCKDWSNYDTLTLYNEPQIPTDTYTILSNGHVGIKLDNLEPTQRHRNEQYPGPFTKYSSISNIIKFSVNYGADYFDASDFTKVGDYYDLGVFPDIRAGQIKTYIRDTKHFIIFIENKEPILNSSTLGITTAKVFGYTLIVQGTSIPGNDPFQLALINQVYQAENGSQNPFRIMLNVVFNEFGNYWSIPIGTEMANLNRINASRIHIGSETGPEPFDFDTITRLQVN